MKKVVSLLMCMCMVLGLTGCMYSDNKLVVDTNNKVTMTVKLGFEKTATDNYMKELGSSADEMGGSEMKLETIDGKEYYTMNQTATLTVDEVNESGKGVFMIGQDKFYLYSSDSTALALGGGSSDSSAYGDMLSGAETKDIVSYLAYNVTLTGDIVKTNGVVSETDKKTVTFTFDAEKEASEIEWYAYTSDSADPAADKAQVKKDAEEVAKAREEALKELENLSTDTTKPVIKGVKKNKKYTNKAVAYITDDFGVKKITINKKTVKLSKLKTVKKGKYKGYYKLTINTGKKKLKVTLAVTDTSKNKKSVSFTIKGKKKFIKKVKGSFTYK